MTDVTTPLLQCVTNLRSMRGDFDGVNETTMAPSRQLEILADAALLAREHGLDNLAEDLADLNILSDLQRAKDVAGRAIIELHAKALADLQPREYAVVELMGHRTRIGAVAEIEQFGAKFLRIDVMDTSGAFDHQEDYSGPAIYCLTRCTAEFAKAKAAQYGGYRQPSLLGFAASEDDGLDDENGE